MRWRQGQISGSEVPLVRVGVLLATFSGLRLGELLALRHDRVDLLHRRIHGVEQRQELPDGTRLYGPPKTAAGVRTITIPPHVVPEVDRICLWSLGSSCPSPTRCVRRFDSLNWAFAESGRPGSNRHDQLGRSSATIF